MSTYKKIFSFVIFTLLFSGIALTTKQVLVIKKINCNHCPKVAVDFLSSYLGLPLITLNQRQLEQDLKNIIPTKKLAIIKKFPNSLNIEIALDSFQIPIVFLNQDITQAPPDKLPQSAPSRYILLKNGEIISAASQLPSRIFISQRLNAGQLKQASLFLKTISSQSLDYKTIFIQENIIYIKLSTGQTTIVPLSKDPEVFISSLHSIQQEATIKTAKIIDFRYNNPVLK